MRPGVQNTVIILPWAFLAFVSIFLLNFFFKDKLGFGLGLGIKLGLVFVVFPRSRLLLFMKTTIDCCSKWHQILQMASTTYGKELHRRLDTQPLLAGSSQNSGWLPRVGPTVFI